MTEAFFTAAGIAGAILAGTSLGLLVRGSAGLVAAWVGGACVAAMAFLALAARGPMVALSLGLGVLSLLLATRGPNAAVAALAPLAGALWAESSVAIAAAVAIPWSLPKDRVALLSWGAFALVAILLPAAWIGHPWPARAAALLASAALVYAGRRKLDEAVPGPAARRAVLLGVALLPVLLFVGMAVAQDRIPLATGSLAVVLALALGPVAMTLAAAVGAIGVLAIASTTSPLKPLTVGVLVAAVLCATLLSPRALVVLAIPVGASLAVGAAVLVARLGGVRTRGGTEAPTSPERRII